jgi:hypothetical protein
MVSTLSGRASRKRCRRSRRLPQTYPLKLILNLALSVNIKKARGAKIRYCIEHPGILDDAGKVRAPFDGEIHVTNNDWEFYLGDTVWAPIADKCGPWRMTIELDNKILAEKTFNVFDDSVGML